MKRLEQLITWTCLAGAAIVVLYGVVQLWDMVLEAV